MNRIPFLLVAIVGLLLFSTACTKTRTVVGTETVEVKVPVAVYPVYEHQVPVPPAPLPPRPTDARDALEVALGKWCEAVAYMVVAHPLLQAASGQKPGILGAYPECED